jgi:hypothetical protein
MVVADHLAGRIARLDDHVRAEADKEASIEEK